MSKEITFSLTVKTVEGAQPMPTHMLMEYLESVIESQSLLQVTNIVRDY
jgi:hypothetical protein